MGLLPLKLGRSSLLSLLLWTTVVVCLAQSGASLLSPELLANAKKWYGQGVERVLREWEELLNTSKSQQDQEKLQAINAYVNKQIKFVSDETHWKQEDYWATPLETMGTGMGDCEDFVISKYFSLIQAGVDQQKLRITYVKALKINQAHMVLAYYATPRSEPLILDNLISTIEPASKRRDLAPVYSFNGMGMWLERQRGSSIKVGTASRLNMWVDLVLRMEEQGLKSWLISP